MINLLPLKGCKICVTGVSSKEEDIAAKIIKEMGGTFSTNLSKDIYCLLVKRVGSKKHLTAQNLGIPSLEMEWLFCCKTEYKKLEFDLYKVRPFLGCMITCTQVTPEIRFKLQKLIEENGGKYNPVLDKDSCTHLVAVNTEGEKYLHAKSWGTVYIVTLAWVEECALQKKFLPEKNFILGINQISNAIETSKLIDKTDILKSRNSFNNLKILNKSSSTNNLILKNELNNQESNNRPSSLLPTNLYSIDKLPSPTLVQNDKRNILKSEIFFISGFQSDIRDYIIRMIINGGGRRHHVLSVSVTKVIFGEFVDQRLINSLKNHPCGAIRVRLQWLVDLLIPKSDTEIDQKCNNDENINELKSINIEKEDEKNEFELFSQKTFSPLNKKRVSSYSNFKLAKQKGDDFKKISRREIEGNEEDECMNYSNHEEPSFDMESQIVFFD